MHIDTLRSIIGYVSTQISMSVQWTTTVVTRKQFVITPKEVSRAPADQNTPGMDFPVCYRYLVFSNT